MSHTMLRPFIVNVSVLGYFPLDMMNRDVWRSFTIRETRIPKLMGSKHKYI